MDYRFWACDLLSTTGEGKLARLYIKNQKIFLKNKINNKLKFSFLNHKYISPFVGIIFCWYFFIRGKQVHYINYLPLWNFFIFLFLPPRTKIGPITGGANFKKNFIRKYIFPIFYNISQIIIYCRYNSVHFSTELLKKNLFNSIKNISSYNYVLKSLKKKKLERKKIDFLIYFRQHKNKKDFFDTKIIKKLLILNFKIYVFGDKLKINGVINLGKLSNEQVNKYLSITRYSIASGENLLSFFTIECINNNVKILINTNKKNINYKLKNNFINTYYNSVNFWKSLKNNSK